MEEIRYIPLDSITKLSDKIRSHIRTKDVMINDETWEYHYFSGELDYIQKSFIEDKVFYTKTIRFYKKLPSWCSESGFYLEEGMRVNHGKFHDYKIDQYGKNIGELKIEHWEHGKKNGIFKQWIEDDKLIIDEQYSYDNPIGTIKRYCPNCGNLYLIEYYDEHGKPFGEHIEYYCHGKDKELSIEKKSIFYDGHDNYEIIEYFDNYEYKVGFKKISNSQQIKLHYKYYGKGKGKSKVYNETGYLMEEFSLLNGLKNGHYKSYTKSGSIIEEGDYKDDVRVGNWVVNQDLITDEDDD